MREAIRKKLECGAPLRLTITALNTKQNYISRHGQQNTELFQRSQRHTNSAALNGRKVLYTEANQLRKAFLRQASIFPDLLYIFADFDEYSARDCAPQPLKLSIHSGGIEHPCRCR